MHKLDIDKIIAKNRDYDRHTFNPEKEKDRNKEDAKGGEKHGRS